MSNIAKNAAVAAVTVCLGVAATKPASAWDYGHGHRYGPYAYRFEYPRYGSYGYRPSYRHRFHTYNGHRTFYPPGTGGYALAPPHGPGGL